MTKSNEQISRMKAMMTYGLTTESKNSYKAIEHSKEGADGKMYAIIREGAKFYIKVANKKNNLVKEDYEYIGGFRNRKDHEYSSYANALKNFDMKMMSVKESCGKNNIIIESWNPDKREELAVESTDRMRKEIERQRQIMSNTKVIQENKNYTVKLNESECCKVDKECAATQKDNIKHEKNSNGEPTKQGGDPFVEKAEAEAAKTQKANGKKEFKAVMEGEQVLGWNDNADYMDMSHGTEVGDSAPYCDKEEKTIEEGTAMHNSDNQNSPAVGVGEVGDDAPFDEKLHEGFELSDEEEIDVEDDDVEFDDEVDMDDEADFEDEMAEDPIEADVEEVDFESDLEDEASDEFNGDMEARMSAIEDMLAKIAEKLGVDAFEDDSLYDDEEAEDVDADDEGAEEMMDVEPMEDEEPIEDETVEDEEEVEVFESVNYQKMVQEDKMDYFGKHPAYQKEPMELPSNKHQEMSDYYDMNDESVESEQPFGTKIGDTAPFTVNPQQIQNAIAESLRRILKKKI
ncbi:MAG: hypothetical protein IKT40_04620 [Bacilli bacterium]|nr:hypothetical protein [Bacilli bacterium]